MTPAVLRIQDLTFRIGGRTLLDRATVAVPDGHRVGLVGRNGSGKTTLLRLIAGEFQPDGGIITVSRGARIVRLSQEAPDGPASPIDTVLAADGERTALLAEAASARDAERIAETHERLATIEAHAAPARAATILAGLGFDDEAQQRSLAEFSGGWRMRVGLARALFARPDLLLLDEPTNHLDLEATLWLEGHLARRNGTLIVVSHERTLLNRGVDEIVHLEAGKLTLYAGGYDRFEGTRREKLQRQARMHTRQKAERRRIQAFVERFRAKATKARQAQSRLKMLARMEPVTAIIEQRTASFSFPNPKPLPPPLIALDDAAVGYGTGEAVLSGLDLRIDMDDRVALLGANGNGKSTLVRLMAGRLEARSGRVSRARTLRVGYFAQHQAEELEPDDTPLSHAGRLTPSAPETSARAHLGRFGLAGERADVKVASLSGGERARLLFAMMSGRAPHLMLLDEPTNHLDVDAREALVHAINEYRGGVVLISHDAHLIDLVCDRLWLVAGGTCRPFEGDLEDYRRLVLERRRRDRRPVGRNAPGEKAAGRRGARRTRAAARARTAPLRRAAREAERRLEDLHAAKAAIEAELADPTLYRDARERMTALQKRLAELDAALAEAEQDWLKAHESLESMG